MMENQHKPCSINPAGTLPVWKKFPAVLLRRTWDLKGYFQGIDIKSDALRELLIKTIIKIVQSGFRNDLCFGSVIEGPTIFGCVAEVTGDY